jgi:leader peptidase (prepilin peptidase)/N-methyltransferase
MPIAWWSLLGLFAAALVNRAADCWLSPHRLACGLTHHPAREAVVWLGLPALFALLAARMADPAELAATCLFAALLALLAVLDLEQRRLPDVVVLPALALALFVHPGGLLPAVAGAAAAGALFAALYALGRRLYGPGALGMGDVKLAALIGAMVGVEQVAIALAMGILLAGAAAAVLLLAGRARRGDSLPYGHFLALAAITALVL